MIPSLPLVLVTWTDAWTDNDAVDLESVHAVHKPTIVHTLGWVLKDDDVGISLVTEFYLSSYRGRTFIPRCNIQSVTQYSLTRKRQTKSESKKETHDPLPTNLAE